MDLEEISSNLIKTFNPTFLGFDCEENNIIILMSSRCFINYPMDLRIKDVYNCLKKTPKIFEGNHVFVYAYTESEFQLVSEDLQED